MQKTHAMTSIDWDTVYKWAIGALGLLITYLTLRKDGASKIANDAVTLYEKYKAISDKQETRIATLEADRDKERERNAQLDTKVTTCYQLIDQLRTDLDIQIALAELRGEQVVGFGGHPATLDEAKERVKKKQITMRRITLDDDESKAA